MRILLLLVYTSVSEQIPLVDGVEFFYILSDFPQSCSINWEEDVEVSHLTFWLVDSAGEERHSLTTVKWRIRGPRSTSSDTKEEGILIAAGWAGVLGLHWASRHTSLAAGWAGGRGWRASLLLPKWVWGEGTCGGLPPGSGESWPPPTPLTSPPPPSKEVVAQDKRRNFAQCWNLNCA